ncbi:MAG: glucosaminidase domain-containing protein [Tannerellaceae bacterium]|nr:glucosaminidase domain-containing protein [Tannerellaceae bacterium]
MKKQSYMEKCLPLAEEAGKVFGINPVVILAQGALESGWGTSTLATRYHSYFGVTGSGTANDYWDGQRVWLGKNSLHFRTYSEPLNSFLDYARLLRSRYPNAANVSDSPEEFARAISYSAYISEVNGDDREAYCKSLISICRTISKMKESLFASIKNEGM